MEKNHEIFQYFEVTYRYFIELL